MITQAEHASAASKKPTTLFFERLGRFVLHFVEMCIVMCIGGFTLNYLFFFGVSKLGFPSLMERYPEPSLMIVGILLTIPMIVWMRFRQHAWRPTLEMASTSIILPVLVIAAARLGLISPNSRLDWLTSLVCPVMLIPMSLRLDLYTGHHLAHDHHMEGSMDHGKM